VTEIEIGQAAVETQVERIWIPDRREVLVVRERTGTRIYALRPCVRSLGLETAAEVSPDGDLQGVIIRVPIPHLIVNVSMGIDLFRRERRRIGLQFNIENLTDRVYPIAKESAFTPVQFSSPRFFSGSVAVRF
jgi:hypothetical protein